MKISIITATYNSAATVRDNLECVSKQEHPAVEHIIIDGGSSDNTLAIAKEFPHLSRIISEGDKGLYDAMNKGIAIATGEVIGILNSDDFYVNDQVLRKVAAVFEDPGVDMCYGDMQYVDQHNTSKVIRNWKAGPCRNSSFYFGWMPPHPTLFVRKKIYDQIGSFNIALKSSADYEFIIRLFVKHQFKSHYIPELMVKMRAGGLSNASLSNRLHANKEDRLAWKMNGLHPGPFIQILKPFRKIFQFRP